MPISVNLFLHDPILLLASIVFLATIVILFWAYKSLTMLKDTQVEEIEMEDDETPQPQHYESSGLVEARLHEISEQLSAISAKLEKIEKNSSKLESFNETVQSLPGNTNIELDKIIKKLDRLELKSGPSVLSGPATGSQEFERIETKLDSIRKLLVLLTETNSPNE